MDFYRLIFAFFCLTLTSNIYAETKLTDKSALVFIHGTNDHRDNADGKYWKKSFTRKIIKALPNPDNYLIAHCDFSHYMWHEDAAGCVAEQMNQLVKEKNIDSIYVITHSNGANVIRWILSNPAYDPNYDAVTPLIKKVIALAPSSGGSSLADEALSGNVVYSGLGWLLGYRNDSVKQQRLGDMNINNEQLLFGKANRPQLPIPFKVVVGSGVTASPISTASYCNGYLLNSALKITQIYLDKCSDGFLNCSSQKEAGDLWFIDKEKTDKERLLSHNQSRHSCFGLEYIIIKELRGQGAKS